jgi:hypothetical protein
MWRHLFAALAGVLAVVGMSSAQSPPPNLLPPIQSVSPGPQPAAPGTVAPASGNYAAEGGYKAAMNAPIPYAAYGPNQMNGCGGCKSDLGFMFGTCKSFFDPCGPLPCDSTGGILGKHLGNKFGRGGCCGIHPFGKPYNTGCNMCTYDSYLNK